MIAIIRNGEAAAAACAEHPMSVNKSASNRVTIKVPLDGLGARRPSLIVTILNPSSSRPWRVKDAQDRQANAGQRRGMVLRIASATSKARQATRPWSSTFMRRFVMVDEPFNNSERTAVTSSATTTVHTKSAGPQRFNQTLLGIVVRVQHISHISIKQRRQVRDQRLMKRPPGALPPDPAPRGASSLMGAWASKRAPGRSSAACAFFQLIGCLLAGCSFLAPVVGQR